MNHTWFIVAQQGIGLSIIDSYLGQQQTVYPQKELKGDSIASMQPVHCILH